MDESFELNESELQEAVEVIRRCSPGTFTARKLYGSNWVTKHPTSFGPRFLKSVRAERLQGITVAQEKTGANARLYIVHVR